MAGFTILPIFFGLSVAEWSDPGVEGRPGRLGPQNAFPLKRLVHASGTIILDAVLPGDTTHAPDVDLGGVLYTWSWVEYPGIGPDSWSSPVGSSGRLEVTVSRVGHYAVRCGRVGFGAVIIHFDKDP